jgi:hypothetical protein
MTNAIATLRTDIANAFAARKAAELLKNASNANMQRNLDKYAKAADHDEVVSVLVACNFSAANINKNAYAVEKMISTARFAASSALDKLDVYTNATIRSMFALEEAKIEITRDVIASLCSNDIKTKFDAKIKATRVQTTKSQSTVATQHNSTINALLALDMLNVARNAANDETFTLKRDNAAVIAIANSFQIAL